MSDQASKQTGHRSEQRAGDRRRVERRKGDRRQDDLPVEVDHHKTDRRKSERRNSINRRQIGRRKTERRRVGKLLNRVFRIRSGEVSTVLILSLIFLGNETARQTSAIVGISDFLDAGGVNGLLYVWIIDAVVIIITAALASLIVDRFNRIQLLRWTAFAFVLVFSVLIFLSTTFNIPGVVLSALLFLISQQQWLVFPLFFWVLANDMFNMAQTKRLFPVIGSWSFIGKILGIGVALLPGLLFPLGLINTGELTIDMVVAFNIVIYLIVFALITVGLRNADLRETKQRGETIRKTLTEGWGFMRDVLSFRYLAIVIIAMGVCTVVIEFRFLGVSKATISNAEDYKRFYSYYRLATAMISFAVQGFLASRIINKIQLKNTFLILPFTMLGSVASMIAAPGIISSVGAQVVSKMTRNTVDTSARKSFTALVPEERRGRVTLFMENYLPAVGTILGCIIAGVVVFVGIRIGSATYFLGYLAITGAVALLSIWIIFKMRAVYDVSLLNWRLKRRGRHSATSLFNALDFDD